VSKKTKLSDEKWDEVFAAREQWREIGLCTEPADRPAAEAIFADFFRRVGREPPTVIWLDGPLSACLAAPVVGLLFSGDQLGGQLWDQLGGQLWDQLWDQLRGQLWDQLRGQLRDQLWGQLRGLARRALSISLPGSEYTYWVGYYSICRDVVGVAYTDDQSALLDQWGSLVRAAGWWLPLDCGVVLACERPSSVRFDDRRLLHCETGPAIECRDGYRVHSWHGTRIPAEWIEQRAELDPATALTWPNIEQRRAAAEILGWHRVLEHLPHRVIDEDKPHVGRLLEVDLPDAPGERFLVVQCATGRTFALPVASECKTALEANAWTYPGLEPQQLLQMRRT
jgi:hypothetical protein